MLYIVFMLPNLSILFGDNILVITCCYNLIISFIIEVKKFKTKNYLILNDGYTISAHAMVHCRTNYRPHCSDIINIWR